MGLHALAVEVDPRQHRRQGPLRDRGAPHQGPPGVQVPPVPGPRPPLPGGHRPGEGRDGRRRPPAGDIRQAEQAKLRSLGPGPPQEGRHPAPAPGRGPGPLRRRPDPQPGAGDGPAVPPARPAARQPRAAVPDLGRLVGRAGRLSRGRRADRRPDARGDPASAACPRTSKGPAPAQRRDPPGPQVADRPQEGDRGVRQGLRQRPGRDPGRRAPAGPDRGHARPPGRRPQADRLAGLARERPARPPRTSPCSPSRS